MPLVRVRYSGSKKLEQPWLVPLEGEIARERLGKAWVERELERFQPPARSWVPAMVLVTVLVGIFLLKYWTF